MSKLTIKPRESLHITDEILATYPLSKYRSPEYYPISAYETDQESVKSDTTEIYWPIESDKTPDFNHVLSENSWHKPTLKSTNHKMAKFNILLHGIRRRKPKYYFKCKETGCTYSFASLKGWNLHHRLHHNMLIVCTICNKKFATPSVHRAHKNLHATRKYVCETCGNTYPYKSSLKTHRKVHSTQHQF